MATHLWCNFPARRVWTRMLSECVGPTWTTWRTSSPSFASASSTSSPTPSSPLLSSSSGSTLSQVWWGGLKSTSTRMIQIWSIKTSVFCWLKSVNFNRKDHISPNSFGSKPTFLGSIWNILHLRETFSTYAEKDAYDKVRSDVIAFLHHCPTISHFSGFLLPAVSSTPLSISLSSLRSYSAKHQLSTLNMSSHNIDDIYYHQVEERRLFYILMTFAE